MDNNNPGSSIIVAEDQRAFQQTFSGIAGQRVLMELARFCRADASCFHPDQRSHALLEGRREVWLRIQRYLRWDNDKLASIYKQQYVPVQDDDEG